MQKKNLQSKFKKSRLLVLFALMLLPLSGHATSKWYYFFTEFHPYPSGAGKIYVSKDKTTDPSTITDWQDDVEIQECVYTISGTDYYIFGKPVGDYIIAGLSTGTRADEMSEWTPTFQENGDITIANVETPYRYTPTSSISDEDSLTCVSKAPLFSTHCTFLIFTKIAAKVADGYKNFGSVSCSKILNDVGDQVVIEATPKDERCHFTHWKRSSDGQEVDTNPLTIDVSNADEYYAYFSCDSATVFNEPDGGYVIWYCDDAATITGPGKAESYSFSQDSLKHTDKINWFVNKKVNTNGSLYTACPQVLHVIGEIFVCNAPSFNSLYNLTNPLAQWSGDEGIAAADISEGLVYYVADLGEKCFVRQKDLTDGIAAKTMYFTQSETVFEGSIPEKIFWSPEDAMATGISPVDVNAAIRLGRTYNINGMEVKSLGRGGIYIIDGKKTFTK